MKYGVSFLILAAASGHFQPSSVENIHQQDQTLSNIEIISESKKPGSAFAMKLTRTSNSSIRVCMHADCIKLTKKWQLLSTLVDGPDIQQLLIESRKDGWFLASLHLDKNLFQLRAPFKLRLPSSVRERIENREDTVSEERKYNLALLKTVTETSQWPCPWINPLAKAEVVSEFGSTRTLPTGEVYSHKGLDLRAKMKTEVRSVASGRVLGADAQVLGGNLIQVDHGQGLISRYFHLSEFKVGKNDQIAANQVIALSGATGRVEAPHLHLELRVRGIAVEPLSTLRLMSQICGPE